MYAVLAVGLGCVNLTRISRLRMARRYRRLTTAEKAELDAAGPRDLAAARWYGWVQAAGLILVAFYFVRFFAPLILSIIRWVVTGLLHSTPAHPGFWAVLVSGCAALVPPATAAFTFIRDHRGHRRAREGRAAREEDQGQEG